jgi:hypothetical protein
VLFKPSLSGIVLVASVMRRPEQFLWPAVGQNKQQQGVEMSQKKSGPCGKCQFFEQAPKPGKVSCKLLGGDVTVSQECVGISCAFRLWYDRLGKAVDGLLLPGPDLVAMAQVARKRVPAYPMAAMTQQ